ncbi:4-diphosphocytidyl-2-C-methyl-D-erythritol kinase [Shimia isoporae]|uniref:4-diphosphocytidyl-2-C-methyl-D-erythritol kinase n=1 Tax=Shimia isoporae TaxID=647720 RepID=A0A4R1NJW9_9RHOB|nr:4-(cytidine 5'-diphospho)-2-C-methyl-D-erythritol kinase [Shimia isoporae]TCL08494.1 4-diphosphocytidyl-2-C-methyl-D-erythritol kinase [Shimia isoporae]
MVRTVEAFAPAKINLTLHVTGQRADGYHLLDSLVVFADIGDRLAVQRAPDTSLTVTGPLAEGVPSDESNLVHKAAKTFGVSAHIALEKHLPAAAGIGGGSSDAAATLRALADLTGKPVPPVADLLSLGADVPVCVGHGWQRMSGIGEEIAPLANGVRWPVLLINPGVDVPTPTVFAALQSKNNPPMPDEFPDWSDRSDAVSWLAAQRNDLEAPAIAARPVIAEVLSALRGCLGCELARMSGSGATCFGLFESVESRDAAAEAIRTDYADWWIETSWILS